MPVHWLCCIPFGCSTGRLAAFTSSCTAWLCGTSESVLRTFYLVKLYDVIRASGDRDVCARYGCWLGEPDLDKPRRVRIYLLLG